MKKLLALSLAMMLVLTGCSIGVKDKTEEKKSEKKTVEERDSHEQGEIKVDKKLKDAELMKALFKDEKNLKPPKSYRMTMTAKIGDFKVDMKTVTYKGNVKYERKTMGVTTVNITMDDGYVYTYKKGEKEGTKYKDVKAAPEESKDMEGENEMGFDIVDEDDFTKDFKDDVITARIEELNGEQVLYMENKDYVEGEKKGITKVWFSLKNRMPVKMISEVDGKVISEMVVTDIEVDKNFSGEFKLPKNIKFTDLGGE